MSLDRREFIANGRRLTPAMWMRLPVLVGGAARLYRREISISPLEVLAIVAQKQFAPLLAGMALMHFAPGFLTKVRRPLNVAGNLVLTVALIALSIKLGPTLKAVSPWAAIAALAAGCMGTARALIPSAPALAISNANRHVGLLLLLCGAHFQNSQHALRAIAEYALAAPLATVLYAKWMRCSLQQLT